MLKALVLCNSITDSLSGPDQKDLQGAGLSGIECTTPFPVKLSLWVFAQLSDQKEVGEARLAIMRADSGRRYFFRPITVRHQDPARATVFCVRLYDCTFPAVGVYFLELWYDGVWVVDQRLELSSRGMR
jgi:hypothetical protein